MHSWKRGPARRLMAVLLGCLVLAPQGVGAQEHKPSAKVRNYVVSARRLYEDLEYERALEQLSRAKRFSRTEADDVVLSLYEGLILADLGKQDEANAAFKAALFLQPDAKLPVKVAPKVQQQFETAREQVRRELAKQEPPPVAVAPVKPPEPQRVPTETKPTDAPVRAPVAEVKPAPPSAVPSGAEVSRESSLRGRAWVPAAAGGVLLVAGAGLFVMAKSEQSKLRNDDASLATEADVEGAVSRGRTFQTVGLGLAGAGVVGLGVAAGMYLLGASPEPQKVGLGVGTDGTSAFVYGRWP